VMGLTRQRVCQVEKQALAKLGQMSEKRAAVTA
jgi:DNA-directed RNA polymerase sigma subunit (sigma70/sigma32)